MVGRKVTVVALLFSGNRKQGHQLGEVGKEVLEVEERLVNMLSVE